MSYKNTIYYQIQKKIMANSSFYIYYYFNLIENTIRMEDLLMQNHIISFDDFRKATGYERQERVNYYQQSKNDLEMVTDSDEDSESMISVASLDQEILAAEL